jgi:hypothetical protein
MLQLDSKTYKVLGSVVNWETKDFFFKLKENFLIESEVIILFIFTKMQIQENFLSLLLLK